MDPVVRSYAKTYTVNDLEEMLRKKLNILENRKEVMSGASGGGVSYSAQSVMDLEKHIGVLVQAIDVRKDLDNGIDYTKDDDSVREVKFGGICQF